MKHISKYFTWLIKYSCIKRIKSDFNGEKTFGFILLEYFVLKDLKPRAILFLLSIKPLHMKLFSCR